MSFAAPAHLRHPIIGDSKHGDLRQNQAYSGPPAVNYSMPVSRDIECILYCVVTIHAGLECHAWDAGVITIWVACGLLPENERVEFSAPSGQDGEISS